MLDDCMAGDWLYNLTSAIEDNKAALLSSASALVDFGAAHPLPEEIDKLLPGAASALMLHKGLRGLLDPSPGDLNHVSLHDVGFLQPFQKGDPCISKSTLKSGHAFHRLFKTSTAWKSLRSAYQKTVGAEDNRGPYLKHIFLDLQACLGVLEPDVADDDIEGETKQATAMDQAAETLRKYIDRRAGDQDALREGALSIIDRLVSKLLSRIWALSKDSMGADSENFARMKLLREVAKATGDVAIFQTMNDVFMHTVEASATVRLSSALAEECDSHENVGKLLQAYLAAHNVKKSALIIGGLRTAMSQVRKFLADVVAGDDGQSGADILKQAQELYKALSEDPTLHEASVVDIEKLSCQLFLKVLKAIVAVKSSHHECSGQFAEAKGQKAAYDKLAKDAIIVNAFVLKPPKWQGATKTLGEGAILPAAEVFLATANVKLDTFGRAEIAAKVALFKQSLEELKMIAGGSADGATWCADLPDDASKELILETFDKSLKDANNDNVTSNKIADLVKAFAFCTSYVFPLYVLSVHAHRKTPRLPKNNGSSKRKAWDAARSLTPSWFFGGENIGVSAELWLNNVSNCRWTMFLM
jgi:hypothetical protein